MAWEYDDTAEESAEAWQRMVFREAPCAAATVNSAPEARHVVAPTGSATASSMYNKALRADGAARPAQCPATGLQAERGGSAGAATAACAANGQQRHSRKRGHEQTGSDAASGSSSEDGDASAGGAAERRQSGRPTKRSRRECRTLADATLITPAAQNPLEPRCWALLRLHCPSCAALLHNVASRALYKLCVTLAACLQAWRPWRAMSWTREPRSATLAYTRRQRVGTGAAALTALRSHPSPRRRLQASAARSGRRRRPQHRHRCPPLTAPRSTCKILAWTPRSAAQPALTCRRVACARPLARCAVKTQRCCWLLCSCRDLESAQRGRLVHLFLSATLQFSR